MGLFFESMKPQERPATQAEGVGRGDDAPCIPPTPPPPRIDEATVLRNTAFIGEVLAQHLLPDKVCRTVDGCGSWTAVFGGCRWGEGLFHKKKASLEDLSAHIHPFFAGRRSSLQFRSAELSSSMQREWEKESKGREIGTQVG